MFANQFLKSTESLIYVALLALQKCCNLGKVECVMPSESVADTSCFLVNDTPHELRHPDDKPR